jgi:hypothetical protein
MSDERNIVNGGNGDDLRPQTPEEERLEALLAAMPRRRCPSRVRESVMAALRRQVEAEPVLAEPLKAKVVSMWFGPRAMKALEVAAVLAIVAIGYKVYHDVRPRVGIGPVELGYRSTPVVAKGGAVADLDVSKAVPAVPATEQPLEEKRELEESEKAKEAEAGLVPKMGKDGPSVDKGGGDFLGLLGAPKEPVQLQVEHLKILAEGRQADQKQLPDYAYQNEAATRQRMAGPKAAPKDFASPKPEVAAPAAKAAATAPLPTPALPLGSVSGAEQPIRMKARAAEKARPLAVAVPPSPKQPEAPISGAKKADSTIAQKSVPARRRIEPATVSTREADGEVRVQEDFFMRGEGVRGQPVHGKAAAEVAGKARDTNAPVLREAQQALQPEPVRPPGAIAENASGRLEKGGPIEDRMYLAGTAGGAGAGASSGPAQQMPKDGARSLYSAGLGGVGGPNGRQAVLQNGQWQMGIATSPTVEQARMAGRSQLRLTYGIPSPPSDLAWLEIETSAPVRDRYLEHNAITDIQAPPAPAQAVRQDNRETTWTAFSQKALAAFGRLVGEFGGRITEVQEVLLMPGARRALMVQCTLAAANGDGLLNTVNQKRMVAVSNSDLQQATNRLPGVSVTRAFPSRQSTTGEAVALNLVQNQRILFRLNEKELAGNTMNLYSNFFVQAPPANWNWNVENRQRAGNFQYSPGQRAGGVEMGWGRNQGKNADAATAPLAGNQSSPGSAAGYGQMRGPETRAGVTTAAPVAAPAPAPETVLYFVLEPDALPATATPSTQNQLPAR